MIQNRLKILLLLLCSSFINKAVLADNLAEIDGDAKDIINSISYVSESGIPSDLLRPFADAVDALDPDLLNEINYSEWKNELEDAVSRGAIDEWIKKILKKLNIQQVIEEIINDSISKVSCTACEWAVNIGRALINRLNEQDVLKVAAGICSLFNAQTPRVCKGVIELMGIDVIQAVKDSDMKPKDICSFLLNTDVCSKGDPRHNWKVTFSQPRKSAQHLTTPPLESTRSLKVLQISDIHHDKLYKIGANAVCGEPVCCREDNGTPMTPDFAAGKWGDYRKCDAPTWLIENAFKHIADTHKDIDYIIWTGDIPPHDIWQRTREGNLEYLRFANSLMAKYFDGIPIFPSVGNHESCPVDSFAPEGAPPRKNMSWLYDELDRLWSRWLPSDTSETIRRGAYYSALARPRLRILSVNSNYCSKNNFWLLKNSTDPAGELAWLIRELDAAEAKGERVHIIGHIPPGQPDCLKVWSKNYYDIINRYEGIIMAQFYGHTHYDEFEVFYDTKDFKRPLSVGYIAPSITPWENVNPGYRIYYVEGDHAKTTRSIIDHETWSMDLEKANLNDNPVWYKAYSARNAYNMSSLLPKDWDDLITRLSKDLELFTTYFINYYRDSAVIPAFTLDDRKKMLCDMRSGRSQDSQNLCHDLQII